MVDANLQGKKKTGNLARLGWRQELCVVVCFETDSHAVALAGLELGGKAGLSPRVEGVCCHTLLKVEYFRQLRRVPV